MNPQCSWLVRGVLVTLAAPALAVLGAACDYGDVALRDPYLTGRIVPQRTRGILVGTSLRVAIRTAYSDGQPARVQSVEVSVEGTEADKRNEPTEDGSTGEWLFEITAAQPGPVTIRAEARAEPELPSFTLAPIVVHFVGTLAETLLLSEPESIPAGLQPFALANVKQTSGDHLVVADATGALLVRDGEQFVVGATISERLHAIAVADVDDDALDDLVVATGTAAAPHLWLWRAAARADVTPVPVPSLGLPAALAAADFDGAGGVDLLVLAPSASPALQYIPGFYRFASATPPPADEIVTYDPIEPTIAVVGKLENDGAPALAVASTARRTVSLWRGSSNRLVEVGAVNDAVNDVEVWPATVALADVTGDGLGDLVVAGVGGRGPQISIYPQRPGAGTNAVEFEAPTALDLSAPPAVLAVADLNGDAVSDLALVTVAEPRRESTLAVWVGTNQFDGSAGPFVLAAGHPIEVPNGAIALAIGNWGGGTELDVAVASYDAATVTIFYDDYD